MKNCLINIIDRCVYEYLTPPEEKEIADIRHSSFVEVVMNAEDAMET